MKNLIELNIDNKEDAEITAFLLKGALKKWKNGPTKSSKSDLLMLNEILKPLK